MNAAPFIHFLVFSRCDIRQSRTKKIFKREIPSFFTFLCWNVASEIVEFHTFYSVLSNLRSLPARQNAKTFLLLLLCNQRYVWKKETGWGKKWNVFFSCFPQKQWFPPLWKHDIFLFLGLVLPTLGQNCGSKTPSPPPSPTNSDISNANAPSSFSLPFLPSEKIQMHWHCLCCSHPTLPPLFLLRPKPNALEQFSTNTFFEKNNKRLYFYDFIPQKYCSEMMWKNNLGTPPIPILWGTKNARGEEGKTSTLFPFLPSSSSFPCS